MKEHIKQNENKINPIFNNGEVPDEWKMTQHWLNDTIKALKNNKAPGFDGISNENIKNTGPRMRNWLLELLQGHQLQMCVLKPY